MASIGLLRSSATASRQLHFKRRIARPFPLKAEPLGRHSVSLGSRDSLRQEAVPYKGWAQFELKIVE